MGSFLNPFFFYLHSVKLLFRSPSWIYLKKPFFHLKIEQEKEEEARAKKLFYNNKRKKERKSKRKLGFRGQPQKLARRGWKNKEKNLLIIIIIIIFTSRNRQHCVRSKEKKWHRHLIIIQLKISISIFFFLSHLFSPVIFSSMVLNGILTKKNYAFFSLFFLSFFWVFFILYHELKLVTYIQCILPLSFASPPSIHIQQHNTQQQQMTIRKINRELWGFEGGVDFASYFASYAEKKERSIKRNREIHSKVNI